MSEGFSLSRRMDNDFSRMLQSVVALLFVMACCTGCDNGKKPDESGVRMKADERLSEQEVEIKGVLTGLLADKISAKTGLNESASTRTFLTESVHVLRSAPASLNQRAVLAQLRKDVLAIKDATSQRHYEFFKIGARGLHITNEKVFSK